MLILKWKSARAVAAAVRTAKRRITFFIRRIRRTPHQHSFKN